MRPDPQKALKCELAYPTKQRFFFHLSQQHEYPAIILSLAD